MEQNWSKSLGNFKYEKRDKRANEVKGILYTKLHGNKHLRGLRPGSVFHARAPRLHACYMRKPHVVLWFCGLCNNHMTSMTSFGRQQLVK